MTVLNELDRLPSRDGHHRPGAANRREGHLPQAAAQDKLIEHKQYINKHGEDLPEVRNWKWA